MDVQIEECGSQDFLIQNASESTVIRNVGHFGHGHFGLGRFGPDIAAKDVSATENAKGGHFGQIINFGLGCVNA